MLVCWGVTCLPVCCGRPAVDGLVPALIQVRRRRTLPTGTLSRHIGLDTSASAAPCAVVHHCVHEHREGVSARHRMPREG